MNLIKDVKSRVDIVNIAGFYGMELNRAYKCRCPFHSENTASFSISQQKQIWKCFGCGKGGDVISLVAELFNLNNYESAKKINDDFNLGIIEKTTRYDINKYQTKKETESSFKKWENETFQFLCDYYKLLKKWKKKCNPTSELYIFAVKNVDYIDYIIDEIFINGTEKDKINFYFYCKKDFKKDFNIIKSRVKAFRNTYRVVN